MYKVLKFLDGIKSTDVHMFDVHITVDIIDNSYKQFVEYCKRMGIKATAFTVVGKDDIETMTSQSYKCTIDELKWFIERDYTIVSDRYSVIRVKIECHPNSTFITELDAENCYIECHTPIINSSSKYNELLAVIGQLNMVYSTPINLIKNDNVSLTTRYHDIDAIERIKQLIDQDKQTLIDLGFKVGNSMYEIAIYDDHPTLNYPQRTNLGECIDVAF